MKLRLLFLIVFLTGCNSAEDKIYSSFKCAKVASMLEHEKEAEMAMAKADKSYGKELKGIDIGAFGMELSQRFTDDLELYKYGMESQMSIVSEVYDSSECQSLYEKD